jgi:hypothetical protein
MFFKKKSIYELKVDTLTSGIHLINAQARVLYDLLTMINSEILEIKNKLNPLTSSTTDQAELNTLIERQMMLEANVFLLKAFIPSLIKQKQLILSQDNARNTSKLCMIDPFALYENISTELGYSYFSGLDYKKMKQAESALQAAQKCESDLTLQSTNAKVLSAMLPGLVVSLFVMAVTTVAIMPTLVNPILAAAIAVLMTLAFVVYVVKSSEIIRDRIKSKMDIKGRIDIGSESNPELFSELDRLEHMSSTLNETQASNSLGRRAAA